MSNSIARPQRLTSLRTRYVLVAVSLFGLMLAGALIGYHSLGSTRSDVAQKLESRKVLLDHMNVIRASLFDAYKATDLFLLAPERGDYRELAFQSIDTALQVSRTLEDSPLLASLGQAEVMSDLVGSLDLLRAQTEELFIIRADPVKQYPAMAVANTVMRPNRNAINNSLALALNEIEAEGSRADAPQAYDGFVRARHLWTQTLSNFRLYLANRVGSFNEEVLPVQEQAVATMHDQLLVVLEELQQMDDDGLLGFESGGALADMRGALSQWHEGFERVKAIHHSDRWRIDSVIMKERIAPIVERTSTVLVDLERRITAELEQDVNAIGNVAGQQTLFLIITVALGLGFVLFVVFSTDRLVLRPIAAVARGLKAEALGKGGVEIPAARSIETRDLVEAFGEMTRQVHIRQKELEYRALHDSLTALPNRALLLEHLEHDIHQARREDRALTLMMIDLNRFKEVNDTLGHEVGDALLVSVGKRFKAALREVDTVARLGGDEFAVLSPNTDESEARMLAQRISKALDQPFVVNDLNLYAAASIGISVFPYHGLDGRTLLQHADVAMYVAKRNGQSYSVYDPDEDESSVLRLAIMGDLRNALDEDALTLYYQPQLDMRTGEVKSVEALLRWFHPRHGQVPPELVIELAEQTGLIGPLTGWVVETALAQVKSWRDRDIGLNVAVNLSVQNLHDEELVTALREKIERIGVPSDALTLEITEGAMMANPRRAVETLSRLDRMGIRLSIDDFGTGFSSLAYLKQLPVDELKIDKSFVLELEHNKNDEAIVRATVGLAHSLELEVVAEGVESSAAWQLLEELGCNFAQGYYMTRPMPAPELEGWLKERPDFRSRHPGTAAV